MQNMALSFSERELDYVKQNTVVYRNNCEWLKEYNMHPITCILYINYKCINETSTVVCVKQKVKITRLF